MCHYESILNISTAPDGIPRSLATPRYIIPSLSIPRYFSDTGIPRIPRAALKQVRAENRCWLLFARCRIYRRSEWITTLSQFYWRVDYCRHLSPVNSSSYILHGHRSFRWLRPEPWNLLVTWACSYCHLPILQTDCNYFKERKIQRTIHILDRPFT